MIVFSIPTDQTLGRDFYKEGDDFKSVHDTKIYTLRVQKVDLPMNVKVQSLMINRGKDIFYA